MMPSNMCYVHPSLIFLGRTIPRFLNQDPRHPSFQTRLTPLNLTAV